MPLLQRVLDVGATLIDYEPIVGTDDRRLVHFGRFAGLAGLSTPLLLRSSLAGLGVELPFASLRPSFEYDSLEDALEAVAAVGAVIAEQGMPAEVGPLVIGVTGYGHVAQGALEVPRPAAEGGRWPQPTSLRNSLPQPLANRSVAVR